MNRFVFAGALASLFLFAVPGAAVTLTTLVNFGGANGALPDGNLSVDASGVIYGTTNGGGEHGVGSAYRVTTSGELTTLASFGGANGGANDVNPSNGVIVDASGTIYGSITDGGPTYRGSIFSVTSSGTLATLKNFTGSNFNNPLGKGRNPLGRLLVDASGTIYGTTREGGTSGNGTVFSLTSSGTLTTLASFNGANGTRPTGGLIADAMGTLYGMTAGGGTSNAGTVFSLTQGGTLTTLASFNGTNGSTPWFSLIAGSSGTLYGITAEGGASNMGTVFSLTSSGTLSTLTSFDLSKGFTPISLIYDGAGMLYGTTERGGAYYGGTVFSLSTGGAFTKLVNFRGFEGAGSTDPSGLPINGLVLVGSDTLYGTTVRGGTSDAGTLFKLTLGGSPIDPPPIDPPPVGGVPEPASWAMLITGFGLTGAAMRRRRVSDFSRGR